MDSLVGREALSQRVRAVKPSGIRKFFDIAATMSDVISLGVGEPDFVTPENIRRAGIRAIEQGETHYTSNYGTLELREAIAELIARRYGVTYDPAHEVMVTVGVSEGIDVTLRALLDPGDEVLVPDPGYVAYEADVVFAGGAVVPVPCHAADDFEVRAAAIEAAITPRSKLLLLGNPSNPTGAVIARDELAKIAALAVRHDLLVLTDEVYSRLVYNGAFTSIVEFPGMHERTVLVDGFSKAYAMTGWRIGYLCAPAALLEGIVKIHQYAIMCAATMSQAAALEALRHGEEAVERMVASYDTRRRIAVEGFNAAGLATYDPKGAFYVFPAIAASGLSSDEFAEQLLYEEKVAVVPGSAFGGAGEGHVRCTYATAQDKLEEAIARIDRFVQRHR
ncbi:MAG: aminotransferase class I/II-fold pyridoxal phosphate-dependent enzyme [Ktedonobacterales bacterium]